MNLWWNIRHFTVETAPHMPGVRPTSLEEVERSMVLNAPQSAGRNQTRAAELLSMTRDTLRYRTKKFNFRPGTAPAESTESGYGPSVPLTPTASKARPIG